MTDSNKQHSFMHVKDGVLYFDDDQEVSLWGINYYPAHSNNYVNIKELGLDYKKVIDDDFEHFKKMGIDVIRVHIFDREISDKEGNLIDNEHLDLTDYLIYKCQQAGIYFFITPIAWWNSMSLTQMIDERYAFWWMENDQPLGFSNYFSKEAMLWHEDALRAQENYLKQFVSRKNRYTGKSYGEDPTICLLEIINEPCYRTYKEMKVGRECTKRVQFQWADENENKMLQTKFYAWLEKNKRSDSEENYLLFRYEFVKNYINRMENIIKDAGAKQPVSYCLAPSDGKNPDDIMKAVADSKAEVMTFGIYTGSSLASLEKMYGEEAVFYKSLEKKARVVYEFGDTCNLNTSIYPACARLFRKRGMQIAAMFQYDPAPIAEYNTGWVRFYLNFLYTPGKAISFMIAREVFHALKRGASYEYPEDNQVFDRFAVSSSSDLSLMKSDSLYMYSNTIPADIFTELQTPSKKTHTIVGCGNSPVVEYDGKGLYIIKIYGDSLEIEVFPDAVMLKEPWHKDPLRAFQNRWMDIRKTDPVAKLEKKTHKMRIKLNGWQSAEAWRVDNSKKKKIECKDMTIDVKPGKYVIEKMQK